MQIIERDIQAETKQEYWHAIRGVIALYQTNEQPFILLVHYRVSRSVPIADRIRGSRRVWSAIGKHQGTHYIVVSCDVHPHTLTFARWMVRILRGNVEAYVYPTRAAAHAQAQILSRQAASR